MAQVYIFNPRATFFVCCTFLNGILGKIYGIAMFEG